MTNCKSQLFDMISEDRIIKDLKDMVAINSVVGDETELAECIGGKLDQLGTDPRFQDVEVAARTFTACLSSMETGH